MTAVAHQLTAPEAHTICAALNADEHIPVTVLIDEHGQVDIWPGRVLTVLEEVTTLRAVIAKTDARICWHKATTTTLERR